MKRQMTKTVTDSFGNVSPVLFERMTGSRLYGTFYNKGECPHNPEYISDYDYRGVFLINPLHQLKISPFNKFNDNIKCEEFDTTFFELRKFIEESVKNNPNYMDLLFGDEESLLGASKEGRMILDNKDLFLTNKISDSFIGYASSQLYRIKNHHRWMTNFPDCYRVEELLTKAFLDGNITPDFISDNFSGELAIKITGQAYQKRTKSNNSLSLNEIFDLYFKKEPFSFYKYVKPHVSNYIHLKSIKGKKIDLNNEWLTFLDKEANFKKYNESLYFVYKGGNGIFSKNRGLKTLSNSSIDDNLFAAILVLDHTKFKKEQSDITDLWSWCVNRNPSRSILEKKYGYDVKHGMHTFRLLDSAIDTFKNGTYTPRLSGERLSIAKDILAGNVPYDSLLHLANEKTNELKKLKGANILKSEADLKSISEIYNSIILNHI